MPTKPNNTVCIIPAFNEETTVATVAYRTITHPLIDKVIVIDDGSTDTTPERVGFVEGVQVISLFKNSGKGAAMRAGLNACHESNVIFLDADLIGLTHTHISDLIRPIINEEVDMTIGLFRGGKFIPTLAHLVSPSLSGQRGIKRKVLDGLDMENIRFGIERALTELWETDQITVKKVKLRGASHLTKEQKRGFGEGVRQRISMFMDIIKFEQDRLKRRFRRKK